MMVPARLAIALQDDGWYLRSDIIWAKKAPMPESVRDRPTSAHEHIFLLTKRPRYYYDADAVRETAETQVDNGWLGQGQTTYSDAIRKQNPTYPVGTAGVQADGKRNLRNVWHLGPEPFAEAHFATFPTEIPRRCILAGTSERGQCPACGAPWVRVVERERSGAVGIARGYHVDAPRPGGQQAAVAYAGAKVFANSTQLGGDPVPTTTTGWQASCTCDAGEPVPQTVLDPFLGAGTTLLVADRLGRHGVGVELNPEYAQMARRRITNDAPLFAMVAD
jgi:hypothetical protein